MSLPEITLVIGIDAKTVQQLEVSHRTWRKFQPQIFEWPWVVFFDGCCPHFARYFWDDAIKRGMIPAHARCVPWPHCIGGNSRAPKYEHQRDKMLSGFCYVPALYVQTPYWAKIDTDAIATREAEWPQAEWFRGSKLPNAPDGYEYLIQNKAPPPDELLYGQLPAIVAPGWNYTKGLNFLGRLEAWGDKTRLKERPRLNIPFDPTHLRVPHKRWCSWNSFYSTGWTKLFVDMLYESGLERGTLPIPSQDSTMWYAAERGGMTVNKVNMKKHGWTNVPKLANLIEQVQSIMRGEEQEAMADA